MCRRRRPARRGPLNPGVHATTILALRFADGVVMAGDRQATEGFEVSSRRIEKLYNADNHSVVAMAGVAGPCLDMARLFQVEMEHYEKIEGGPLALEGKANRLALMVKQNLPAAFQGLVVVPIFAGYDRDAGQGRIFKYDVTGGRYEEREFYATGSGGKEARSTLRKQFRGRPVEDGRDRPGARSPGGRRGHRRRDQRSGPGAGHIPAGQDHHPRRYRGRCRRRAGGGERQAAWRGEGLNSGCTFLRLPRSGHAGQGRVRSQGNIEGQVDRGHGSLPAVSC